jgi:type IV pilus assembly protein PilM
VCFFRKKPNRIIGLDVGNGAIKLVELSRDPKTGKIKLQRFLVRQTPQNSVENGVVKNRPLLRGSLRSLLQQYGARSLQVTTVLTGQNLIVRQAEVPRMSRQEFQKVLQLQADTYFGLPADRLSIDFQIMRDLPGSKMQVFLVGSPKQPILDFATLLKEAGFVVGRVDIEPMAAFRSLRMTGALEQSGPDQQAAVIDLGAGTSNLSIFQGELLRMVRVITVAGNDLSNEICSGQQVQFEEAEKLKQLHGVAPGTPIYETIRPTFERLLRQVSMTLEYYQIENRSTPITQVRVIGGNAKLPGLMEAITSTISDLFERLSLPAPQVALGNPCAHMQIDRRSYAAEQMGPILAVAIGLALGEVAADASH